MRKYELHIIHLRRSLPSDGFLQPARKMAVAPKGIGRLHFEAMLFESKGDFPVKYPETSTILLTVGSSRPTMG